MLETSKPLVGLGLYTPAEAGRLIHVAPGKLTRWLRGHERQGQRYAPLWHAEVDLDDGAVYLSFRDLLEARVAARFIALGLSPQRVRLAIDLARGIVGERPLSTLWLKTDGRTVFLQVVRETGDEPELLDLFSKQYAFNTVVEQSLRDLDFEGRIPTVWWPQGRRAGVLIDPKRAFGQPIEQETSVPAAVLARAAIAEGSVEAAARVWDVPASAIRRAVAFQNGLELRKAA
jgi:uncharacterized protein (DUF433 family)